MKERGYLRMGERIGALGLPTLFVMDVDEIGINVCNVLAGFEGGRHSRN
ncbi:hypothetical protein [Paraburkholderia acidipaludis]|nr:hypothetical protein [Paraburkholderia acidipaludis]